MNWLDMMDPQKRRAMELMQQQQMMQQFTPEMLQQQMPQGMGMLQDMPMPMQQGQAGYGVLAPEANTAMNQAAAGGAQSFGQTAMGALPGLLSFAANMSGGADEQPVAPPAPLAAPVGKSKEGLPTLKKGEGSGVKRKRRYRSAM